MVASFPEKEVWVLVFGHPAVEPLHKEFVWTLSFLGHCFSSTGVSSVLPFTNKGVVLAVEHRSRVCVSVVTNPNHNTIRLNPAGSGRLALKTKLKTKISINDNVSSDTRESCCLVPSHVTTVQLCCSEAIL